MSERLETLNKKIDELVALCHELSEQNKKLVYERNKLIEKNAVVHDKVQSLIKNISSIEAQK